MAYRTQVHNFPWGKDGTMFIIRTPGRDVTYVYAGNDKGACKYESTSCPGGFTISRGNAADTVKQARRNGLEVNAVRYSYQHQGVWTMNAADREILQYGQTPNVIVGPDTATMSGAIHDCSACGAYERAHWLAYAPSMCLSGYRVVGMCSACATQYVNDGRAVDRRPA
jgi:hypothetical protein